MGDSTGTKPDETVELTSDYANNTFFEPSVWDLKILFGEFSGRSSSVDWHTSITLPWAQAKLMAYYLAVNIALHELSQGPIQIPAPVIPAEPPPVPSSENDPIAQAMYQYAVQFRKKFIEGLGEPPAA
jgi:hypothetical protein